MTEYSTLILDDDVWMQRILSKTMQSYGFKNIYLASNGFDAIAIAVENQPSVIIVDIFMPELSGHTVIKILKRIKLTQNIPILVISAMSDVENLGLAVKSGIAGFISKPFTRATIYDKLLDVFGKEKLSMIARGELITTNSIIAKNPDNDSSERSLDLLISDSPFINNITENSIPEKKPVVKQEQILQHYQDDEKRSIESIRKMLLKKKT